MSTQPTRTHGRPAGFTLLEVTISAAILAVLLQTAVSSALLMTRSGQFGVSVIERNARAQNTLQKLAHELRTSSRGVDAATGTPYMTVTGTTGDQRITFRRVASFGTNGSEIVPIWSTPIELFRSGSQLVRRQDGDEAVVMNQVETLDFTVDALGRIDLQVGTVVPASGDSSGQTIRSVQVVRVAPQR